MQGPCWGRWWGRRREPRKGLVAPDAAIPGPSKGSVVKLPGGTAQYLADLLFPLNHVCGHRPSQTQVQRTSSLALSAQALTGEMQSRHPAGPEDVQPLLPLRAGNPRREAAGLGKVRQELELGSCHFPVGAGEQGRG